MNRISRSVIDNNEEEAMSQSSSSLWQTIWDLKMWWMIPMGVFAVLFVLLVLFSDITGDAPFIYTIF